jgi:cell division protein FtsB
MRRFETKYGREARIKRQKRSNLIALVTAVVVVFVLIIVVLGSRSTLNSKNAEYESRKVELNQQIAEQESRSQSLEEYRKYVQTKKYVEEIAKNKFGLLYPEEDVFRPKSTD